HVARHFFSRCPRNSMRKTILLSTALVALALAGGRWWWDARAPDRLAATLAIPPVASAKPALESPRAPRSTDSRPDRAAQLELEIERSLVALDPQQRETAFNSLLPELLRTEPQRLVG